MNPQDTFYRTMNVVTAPLRFLITCIQTLIFIALATLAAIAWPLILYIKGEPVTLVSFIISGLALLAIFTLFYTPGYFVFVGLTLLAIGWVYMMVTQNVPDFFSVGWEVRAAIFAFLFIGIMQKFLRNHGGGASTPTSLNLQQPSPEEPVSVVTSYKVEFL